MTPRGRSPIDGFADGRVKWWNRDLPGKAGNREAGGFVNSTVTGNIKCYDYFSSFGLLAI